MCNTWIEPRPKQQFASINLPCSGELDTKLLRNSWCVLLYGRSDKIIYLANTRHQPNVVPMLVHHL